MKVSHRFRYLFRNRDYSFAKPNFIFGGSAESMITMDKDQNDPNCHDDSDERALLEDFSEPKESHKEKKCRPESISFPATDGEFMKEQNLRFLKELEWFRKRAPITELECLRRRAPITDPNLGEGARASVVRSAAEQDSENLTATQKENENHVHS